MTPWHKVLKLSHVCLHCWCDQQTWSWTDASRPSLVEVLGQAQVIPIWVWVAIASHGLQRNPHLQTFLFEISHLSDSLTRWPVDPLMHWLVDPMTHWLIDLRFRDQRLINSSIQGLRDLWTRDQRLRNSGTFGLKDSGKNPQLLSETQRLRDSCSFFGGKKTYLRTLLFAFRMMTYFTAISKSLKNE